MPDTLTRAAAPRSRAAIPTSLAVVAIGASVLVAAMAAAEDGQRAAVTFVNDTDWDVGIELVLDGDSRMPVATIGAGRSRTVEEILVPGPTWQLAWDVDGREVSRSEIGDESLRDAEYRISVPGGVTAALRAEGVPPSP